MKIFKSQNTFYCFSPPVMLATFIIEIMLALYVIARYKMTPLARVVAAQLILLATFQLAEFNVCGEKLSGVWAKVGFVAITLLPILGLTQVYVLARRRVNAFLWLAYGSAVGIAAGFVFWPTLTNATCNGNYAIFNASTTGAVWLYTAYYFSWLLIGMALAAQAADKAPPHIKRALTLQMVGYLFFILPTAVAVVLRPAAIAGTPSIMCGFAVLYALIITFGILPTAHLTKKR